MSARLAYNTTPLCGNPECACGKPWTLCEEFMQFENDGPWCHRCGWNEAAHPQPRSSSRPRFDGGADTSDGSGGRGTAAPPSPGDDRG